MQGKTNIKLSVLDLVPVVEGETLTEAFRNTVDLAQHAEKWGYHRYRWLNTTAWKGSPVLPPP